MVTADDVLAYWFSDRARRAWFETDPEFDAELRERFGETHAAAVRGELDAWTGAPASCLALVIVLDQLSRNLYRGTPLAFAADALASAHADHALADGFDQRVPLERRMFYYLPYEHTEQLAAQQRAVALFEQLVADYRREGTPDAEAVEALEYARRHCEIIERFGRFPHRNAILGRTSTPEELAFLQEPMSSF
jgi:uncharacterized protein (DUF924 family)